MRRQLHRGGLGRCLAAARSGFFWLRAINLWRFLFWRARIAVALWHPLAAEQWSSERADSPDASLRVAHRVESFSQSVMLSDFNVTATHLQRCAWVLQHAYPVPRQMRLRGTTGKKRPRVPQKHVLCLPALPTELRHSVQMKKHVSVLPSRDHLR
jgi:hypothetical protein